MYYDHKCDLKVIGNWTNCVVTTKLLVKDVRSMLPWGMELADQSLTDSDTHLVRHHFNTQQHAQMNLPPHNMPLNFCEQAIGIPGIRRTTNLYTAGVTEPFYYMPRQWSDSATAATAGVLLWGLEKRLAHIENKTEESCGNFQVTRHCNKKD